MKPVPPPRACNGCGAVPGAVHAVGCGIARCSLCGGQLISCGCVYERAGVAEEMPEEIYLNGPTEKMWQWYDAEVKRLGGPLPWSGEYPDCDVCREFNLWCRMVPGKGWVPCEQEHPEATEDLNRLHLVASWDRDLRRWVRRAS